MVYSLVVLVMFLSSLGLPLPEEFSIISLGVLSYMGAHPEIYPPPYEGAPYVKVLPSIIVCAGSIFLSDFLIFSVGRRFGPSIFKSEWFGRHVKPDKLDKVKTWARKWGSVVPGLFRLIPGARFPGHLLCGALGIKKSAFIAVDGFVVALVVPTQILLISHYGEVVVDVIKKFQPFIIGFCLIILTGLFWNLYKFFKSKSD